MLPYLRGRGLAFHAIEPDPHTRRQARRRAADLDCGIELREGRAESLPYPDGFFDAVVVSFVLCSVESVETSVGEIARVLKPGGERRFLGHVRAEGWRAASRRR